MSTIEVSSLTKQFQRRKKQEGFWGSLASLINPAYETKTAVDAVSFQVEQGEIIGYIGPNGAGKSTTIKMLSGILVPTSGLIEVKGLVPYRQRKEHARNIGVVFGQRTSLWWDVPVIDSLHLLRDIYKVPQAQYRRNLDRYTDLLGLGEFLNVPVRQLSLGQRVRADIAAALMHDPAILFLDEPTIGVDVISKERWNTLYLHRPDLFTTSLEQMLTYAMLAIILNFFLNPSNLARYYITAQIRSGDIQMDLLRPLDFPFHLLARSAGMTLFNLMILCLPAFLLGALFLGLKAPASLLSGLLFLPSLALAFLVAVSLQFLVGLISVYTIGARRIVWFYLAVLRFFSGQMIPLWIFSPLLAQIAALLPFQTLVGIPLSIYIGRLDGAQAAQALGLQAVWAAALLLLGRLIWSRAYRKLTVQGG